MTNNEKIKSNGLFESLSRVCVSLEVLRKEWLWRAVSAIGNKIAWFMPSREFYPFNVVKCMGGGGRGNGGETLKLFPSAENLITLDMIINPRKLIFKK